MSSPTTSHPPGYRLRRGRNWLFLGLLYAAYYLCRYNFSIVSPEITAEFGYNKRQLGTISTARDGGYAIGQFVNGLFADGLGGKQAMAVGALGTIGLNVLFGVTSLTSISWMLLALVLIRMIDGYLQAFGAPGMVKINTAWFQRRERGRFAGIYGGVIVLGTFAVGALGRYLLGGFTLPIVGWTLPKQDWRSLFFIPPIVVVMALILMWLNVKNHPEHAGYSIPHDDGVHDIETKLPIAIVFKTIAGNILVWFNALAYFCTGFVRRAIEAWWVLYLVQVWHADKQSIYYGTLVWSLPLAAFLGSYSAGLLSDSVFKGKRTPVAALLYAVETLSILFSFFMISYTSMVGPAVACILLTLISFTCNSTHSIIGTAVAMDLGGRKMAGFACGVIDSFQYLGAMLAGAVLGNLIDHYGWNVLFGAMLPFSLFGTLLMTAVWFRTKNHDVKGS